MWVVGGHAGIDHVGKHAFIVAYLKFLRIRIKSEFLHQLNNTLVPILEIFRIPCISVHGFTSSLNVSPLPARSLARNVLKEDQISSLRWICTVWKLGSWICEKY